MPVVRAGEVCMASFQGPGGGVAHVRGRDPFIMPTPRPRIVRSGLMRRPLLPLAALVLTACHSQPPPAAGPRAPVDDRTVIGVYAGVLPCADCEGIRTQLSVLAGGRYAMQETYLGRSTLVFNDHGTWTANWSDSRLALTSSRRSYPRYFRAQSPDELLALDRQGQVIADSRVNLSLRRAH